MVYQWVFAPPPYSVPEDSYDHITAEQKIYRIFKYYTPEFMSTRPGTEPDWSFLLYVTRNEHLRALQD
jgi:hypothetical protein